MFTFTVGTSRVRPAARDLLVHDHFYSRQGTTTIPRNV